jgi:DNA-binding IclR family transcriptional regulator
MKTAGRRQEPEPVGVLERGLKLLDYLFQTGEEPLQRIAEANGLPSPTAHRLLHGLERHGYALSNGHGAYRLGLKALWLTPAREPVRHLLEDLRAATGETANFSVLLGGEMEFIERAPSDHPLAFVVAIGERVPLAASAMGKAVLAYHRELWDTVELFARTPHSLMDRDGLKRELLAVLHEGVAFDREEYIEGVLCVAAPVMDGGGQAVGAVSVSGPAVRFTEADAREAAPLLCQVADQVGRILAEGAFASAHSLADEEREAGR